ncbi:uncharacterized protein KGF55_003076 [Candida pseudojiufengensis]|uniref:uncharacterized protein n=1 Tax=Candida pseudojiufengensis TaxID=497109 RepID=UPI0022255758|nr:uncharacterized protein KGF55_003076 [Candida pseudojiufengensis]KAI5963284.1 hypothetical protein KGF55_003076 [Candida pseudojiufengensis]
MPAFNEFLHRSISTGASNDLNAYLHNIFLEAPIPVLLTRLLSESDENERTLFYPAEEILIQHESNKTKSKPAMGY